MYNNSQVQQGFNNNKQEMLYLSDAIRGKYVHDEFNVIEAPCGCGKSEYAVNKLPYEILGSKPQFNKVLYLIDTCAGRHSMLLTACGTAALYSLY